MRMAPLLRPVEPLPSVSRSSTTIRRNPCLSAVIDRLQAILQPITPPPMITTSAVSVVIVMLSDPGQGVFPRLSGYSVRLVIA